MSARCKCGAPVSEPARCTNGHDQPTDSLDRIADLVAERIVIDYGRLADAVAGRLAGLVPQPDELVDVKGAARILGVSPDTVYEHADELGVARIGSGPKAHLRFDPKRLRRAGRARTDLEIAGAAQPQRVPAAGVPLLPVRGKAA